MEDKFLKKEKNPLFYTRCGISFGWIGGTWPFGFFALFTDRVEVGLLSEKYSILLDEIVSIEECGFLPFSFPLLGRGLRIKTKRSDVPQYLVVYLKKSKEMDSLIIKKTV